MRGLWKKDLALIGTNRSVLAAVVLVTVLMIVAQNYQFVMFYAALMGGFQMLGTITYDTANNGMEYLLTLPVTRKQYAAEKYLFGYGFGLALLFFGTVVAIVSALVTGNPFDPAEMAFTLECALLLLGFLLAAFLPIQFKYGGDNGRVIMFSVFVVAFLCVFAVGKAAESFGIDLEALLIQLQALGVPVIFAGLAVLLAAASFISWKVSCGILEKKEY